MFGVTYFPVTRVIDGESMTLFTRDPRSSYMLRTWSDEEFAHAFRTTTGML